MSAKINPITGNSSNSKREIELTTNNVRNKFNNKNEDDEESLLIPKPKIQSNKQEQPRKCHQMKQTFIKIHKEIALAVNGFKNCLATIFCCKSEKSIMMRMWMKKLRFKYWAHFLLAISLFIMMVVFALLESSSGSSNVSFDGNNYSFDISMQNCKLFLSENEDPDKKIKIHHYLSYFTFERTLSVKEINSDSHSSFIKMLSAKNDLKYCQLNIYIPKSININDFTFNCEQECVIVSDMRQINMNKAFLKGDSVYVNFRNLAISDELQYTAETGTFQINEFSFNGVISLILKYGDVILQSSNDYSISWKNEKHTFCFAGPYIQNQSFTSCSVSGYPDTVSFQNSTSCQGVASLCRTSNCLNTPLINIMQVSGNTYANLIPSTGEDVSNNVPLSIFKGAPYDEKLGFEDHFEKEIRTKTDVNIKDKDPIFIVDLGKRELQQSTYQKWTVVSNPSFAYLRPWWLSVFSLNLLTLKTVKLSGSLAPGICPFHFKNSLKDYHSTQIMLSNYFSLDRAEVSFVQGESQIRPSNDYPTSSGIQKFSSNKPISEEWLKVDVSPELRYSLHSIDINSQKFIIPTLLLSFLGAFLIGLTILKLIMIATMVSYKSIIKMSEHTEKYKSTSLKFKIGDENVNEEEDDENKKINIANLLNESSFKSFMKNVPRISSFVGFYSLILIKKFILNSVEDFCSCLFREADPKEIRSMESGNEPSNQIEMDEFKLKNNYEKFCFLNHYPERKLADSIKIFESYGYTLIPNLNNLAFTNIIEKKDVVISNRDEIMTKDSLEVFTESFYSVTNLEMDVIFVDDFERKYIEFCQILKLEKKKIDFNITATKVGISIINREKQKLGRLKEKRTVQKPILVKSLNFFLKCVSCCTKNKYEYKIREEKVFIIDERVLEKQFEILESKDIIMLEEGDSESVELFDKGKKNKLGDLAKEKMLFYPKWWAHELLFILFHMTFTGVLMLPFIFLALLYEISYDPYSTINQEYLISLQDLMWSPWSLPHRLPVFIEWNIVIISFTFVFAGFNFADDMFYFWYSKFPEDKTFLETQRSLSSSKFKKFLANIQWILIFFMILCYSCYVGLVLMWLLLGAIINPNNFLVYASASLTFLTFVSTKYASFKSLSDEGFKAVRNMVKDYVNKQIKEISTFLGKELNKAYLAVKNDSTVKSITDFTVQNASAFGLGEELKMLKDIGENPDKLMNAVKENAKEIIMDPALIVKSLEQTRDKMIEKGENFLREQCRLNEIPEEFVDIMLSTILKNFNSEKKNKKNHRETLKNIVSKFVAKKSETNLKMKIPAELIKSLLDFILITSESHKTPENLEILSIELATNLIYFGMNEFFQKRDESKEAAKTKQLLKKLLYVVESVTSLNKKKIFKNLKELIIEAGLIINENIVPFSFIIDIIDLMVNEEAEHKYKEAILKLLETISIPSDLGFLIALLIMSDKNEPVIVFKGQSIETFEQVNSVFRKILKNFEDKLEIQGNKNIMGLFDKLLTAFYMLAKGKLNKKSIELLIDGLSDKNKKIVDILPLSLLITTKDLKTDLRLEMKEALEKYNFDREIYQDIVALMSSNSWKIFHKNRFENFHKSQLIKSIAGKVNMEVEQLIGFISLFYRNFDQQKFIDAFVYRLFEKEDKAIIQDIQNIILLLVYPDPFVVKAIADKFKMKNEEIFKFILDTDRITPRFKKNHSEYYKHLEAKDKKDKQEGTVINLEKPNNIPSNLIKKPSLKGRLAPEISGPKNFLIEVINWIDDEFKIKKEKLQKNSIKDRIQLIWNMITINTGSVEKSQDPLLAGKVKETCKFFAEKFLFDLNYLENLVFILLNDKSKNCADSLFSFLKDDPFCISKGVVDQIYGLIQNQDSALNPKAFFRSIKKYVPKVLEPYQIFISKIFFPQSNTDLDQSDEELIQSITEIYFSKNNKTEDNLKDKFLKFASFHFQDHADVKSFISMIPYFEHIDKENSQADENPPEDIPPEDKQDKKKISKKPTNIDKINESTTILADRIVDMFSVIILEQSNYNDYIKKVHEIIFGKDPKFGNREEFEKVFKSLTLLKYRKNKSWYEKKTFLEDFRLNCGLDPDLILNLKYYFSTNADCYAQIFIKFFKNRHGIDSISKQSLLAIFSMFTTNRNTQDISNLLKIPTYVIDSAALSARLFHLKKGENYTKSSEDHLQTLFKDISESQVTDKWCKNLNIKKEEFVLLLKLFYNSMTLKDLSSIFKQFGFGMIFDQTVFFGILSLMPTNLYNPNKAASKRTYEFMKNQRKNLYKILGISEIKADFVLDIQQGNYSFIDFLNNSVLSQGTEEYCFNINNKDKTFEKLSPYLLGLVIAQDDSEINIQNLMEEFVYNEQIDAPLNGFKQLAFYMFKNFNIHPILLLDVLESKDAVHFMKDLDHNTHDAHFLFDTFLDSIVKLRLDILEVFFIFDLFIVFNFWSKLDYKTPYENENPKILDERFYQMFGEWMSSFVGILRKDDSNSNDEEKVSIKTVIENFITKPYNKTMENIIGKQKIIGGALKYKMLQMILFAVIKKLRTIYKNRYSTDEEEQNTNVKYFFFYFDLMLFIFEILLLLVKEKESLSECKYGKFKFVSWVLGAVFPEFFSKNSLYTLERHCRPSVLKRNKAEIIKDLLEKGLEHYEIYPKEEDFQEEDFRKNLKDFVEGNKFPWNQFPREPEKCHKLNFFLRQCFEEKLFFWKEEILLPNSDNDGDSVFDKIYNLNPKLFLERKNIAIELLITFVKSFGKIKKPPVKEKYETKEKRLLVLVSKYMNSELYNLSLLIEFFLNNDLDHKELGDEKFENFFNLMQLPSKTFFSIMRPILMSTFFSSSKFDEKILPHFLTPVAIFDKVLFPNIAIEDIGKDKQLKNKVDPCVRIESLFEKSAFKIEEKQTLNLLLSMFIGSKEGWKRYLQLNTKESKLKHFFSELINKFDANNRQNIEFLTMDEKTLSDFNPRIPIFHMGSKKNTKDDNSLLLESLFDTKHIKALFSNKPPPKLKPSENNSDSKILEDYNLKNISNFYQVLDVFVDKDPLKIISLASVGHFKNLFNLNKKTNLFLQHCSVLIHISSSKTDPSEVESMIHELNRKENKEFNKAIFQKVPYSYIKLLHSFALNRPEVLLLFLEKIMDNENLQFISIFFWFIILRFPSEYRADFDENKRYVSMLLCVFPMTILVEFVSSGIFPNVLKENFDINEDLKKITEHLNDLKKLLKLSLNKCFEFIHSYPEYLRGDSSDGDIGDIIQAIIDDLEYLTKQREDIDKLKGKTKNKEKYKNYESFDFDKGTTFINWFLKILKNKALFKFQELIQNLILMICDLSQLKKEQPYPVIYCIIRLLKKFQRTEEFSNEEEQEFSKISGILVKIVKNMGFDKQESKIIINLLHILSLKTEPKQEEKDNSLLNKDENKAEIEINEVQNSGEDPAFDMKIEEDSNFNKSLNKSNLEAKKIETSDFVLTFDKLIKNFNLNEKDSKILKNIILVLAANEDNKQPERNSFIDEGENMYQAYSIESFIEKVVNNLGFHEKESKVIQTLIRVMPQIKEPHEAELPPLNESNHPAVKLKAESSVYLNIFETVSKILCLKEIESKIIRNILLELPPREEESLDNKDASPNTSEARSLHSDSKENEYLNSVFFRIVKALMNFLGLKNQEILFIQTLILKVSLKIQENCSDSDNTMLSENKEENLNQIKTNNLILEKNNKTEFSCFFIIDAIIKKLGLKAGEYKLIKIILLGMSGVSKPYDIEWDWGNSMSNTIKKEKSNTFLMKNYSEEGSNFVKIIETIFKNFGFKEKESKIILVETLINSLGTQEIELNFNILAETLSKNFGFEVNDAKVILIENLIKKLNFTKRNTNFFEFVKTIIENSQCTEDKQKSLIVDTFLKNLSFKKNNFLTSIFTDTLVKNIDFKENKPALEYINTYIENVSHDELIYHRISGMFYWIIGEGNFNYNSVEILEAIAKELGFTNKVLANMLCQALINKLTFTDKEIKIIETLLQLLLKSSGQQENYKPEDSDFNKVIEKLIKSLDFDEKISKFIESILMAISLRQLNFSGSREEMMLLLFNKLGCFCSPSQSEKVKSFLKILLFILRDDFNISEIESYFMELSQYILKDILKNESASKNKFQKKFNENIKKVFTIVLKIREMINKGKELNKFKKRAKLVKITDDIGSLIFTEINQESKGLFTSILHLVKGDIQKVGSDLLILLNIPPGKQEFVKDIFVKLEGIIKNPHQYINSMISGYSQKLMGGNDLSSLKDIMKKVGGTEEMNSQDLFKLIDTDRSGKINFQEFKTLSKRLGMTLSEHRIKEIFTSVKMEMGESTKSFEFNQKEFEIALNYLQTKSINLALEAMGITKEVLMLILIWLILILLVIFAFIFVGVEAFAIAGTFGAIINSLFPIFGGAALNSKHSSHKDILTGDEFKDTVNKCIKIVQSIKI